MKKKLITVILAVTLGVGTGVLASSALNYKTLAVPSNFKEIGNNKTTVLGGDTIFYVDTLTGIVYFKYKQYNRGGMSVYYGADKKPMLYSEFEKLVSPKANPNVHKYN